MTFIIYSKVIFVIISAYDPLEAGSDWSGRARCPLISTFQRSQMYIYEQLSSRYSRLMNYAILTRFGFDGASQNSQNNCSATDWKNELYRSIDK